MYSDDEDNSVESFVDEDRHTPVDDNARDDSKWDQKEDVEDSSFEASSSYNFSTAAPVEEKKADSKPANNDSFLSAKFSDAEESSFEVGEATNSQSYRKSQDYGINTNTANKSSQPAPVQSKKSMDGDSFDEKSQNSDDHMSHETDEKPEVDEDEDADSAEDSYDELAAQKSKSIPVPTVSETKRDIPAVMKTAPTLAPLSNDSNRSALSSLSTLPPVIDKKTLSNAASDNNLSRVAVAQNVVKSKESDDEDEIDEGIEEESFQEEDDLPDSKAEVALKTSNDLLAQVDSQVLQHKHSNSKMIPVEKKEDSGSDEELTTNERKGRKANIQRLAQVCHAKFILLRVEHRC